MTEAQRLARAWPQPAFLPCFVYGTLRPGEGNYWIEPAVMASVEPCTTSGQMYARGYPWVDFTQPGTVTGSLLLMRAAHELTAGMFDMEIGAGYTARWVDVTLPDHSVLPALAWHTSSRGATWCRPELRVPSGDYHDWPTSAHYRRRARGVVAAPPG